MDTLCNNMFYWMVSYIAVLTHRIIYWYDKVLLSSSDLLLFLYSFIYYTGEGQFIYILAQVLVSRAPFHIVPKGIVSRTLFPAAPYLLNIRAQRTLPISLSPSSAQTKLSYRKCKSRPRQGGLTGLNFRLWFL